MSAEEVKHPETTPSKPELQPPIHFKQNVDNIVQLEDGHYLFLMNNELFRGHPSRTFYEYFPAFGNIHNLLHINEDCVGLIKEKEFIVVETPSMTAMKTFQMDHSIMDVDFNDTRYVIATSDGGVHSYCDDGKEEFVKLPFEFEFIKSIDGGFELDVTNQGIMCTAGKDVFHVKL